MGLNYLALPLVLAFLGEKNFGVWMTLYSIVNWINNFDVGVGNGLKNKLTESLTLKKYELARRYVTTAYVIISGITFVFFILGLVLTFSFNLTKELNIQFLSEDYFKNVTLIIFILTLSNFIIGLYKQLFYATHESAVAGITDMVYQGLIILSVVFLKHFIQNSLIIIALVYGLMNLLVGVVYTFIFFKRNPNLIPKIKYFDRNKIKDIMGIGLEFFIIQLSMIVIFTTDNIIITKFLGAEAVSSYNIILKVYQAFIYAFGILMIPLWPMYTEAYINRNSNWIKRTLSKFNLLYLGTIIAVVILTFKINFFLKLWLGYPLKYPKYLVSFIALFTLIKIYADIYATFINGIGKIRIQVFVMTFGAIINIPLSIFFIKMGLNSSGVILATSCSLLPFIAIIPIYSHLVIKRLENKNEIEQEAI